MKLLDVNLLIYATNEALPWHTLLGFVRLTTRRAVVDPPLTVERAFIMFMSGSSSRV